jgi:cytochrome c-type biogenesis protein CcmE
MRYSIGIFNRTIMKMKRMLSICAIIVLASIAIMINLRAYHENQIYLRKIDSIKKDGLYKPFVDHSELK